MCSSSLSPCCSSIPCMSSVAVTSSLCVCVAGDNPEDAAVRTYLGCIARQASSSALDGCQTVEQVLAQVAAGKLPRVQRLMILPHAEYIEFEPAPPEAGAAGAAAAAAGGGGSALQGGGEAAPPVPLQPVVWFR
jgi:hypothetical protein